MSPCRLIVAVVPWSPPPEKIVIRIANLGSCIHVELYVPLSEARAVGGPGGDGGGGSPGGPGL